MNRYLTAYCDPTMDPLLISLVSACTALVASIVAPFVTLTVARQRFNATVLSANRQKWIETLRDMLVEIDVQTSRLHFEASPPGKQ